MAKSSLNKTPRSFAGCCALAMLLLTACNAWAFDSDPYKTKAPKIDPLELPESKLNLSREDVYRQQGEPQSLFKYIAQQTQFNFVYEAVYNDNIFLQDNLKKDDYIQTLNGTVIFADPRGSILYGIQYVAEGVRYTRQNANALNHDLLALIDLDPGGRTRFRTNYTMSIQNSLTFGAFDVDIFRVSSDFQRSMQHKWDTRLQYELSKANSLSWQTSYSIFDDQVTHDASTDRRSFNSTLDLERAVAPTWTLFSGLSYGRVEVPGDVLKNNWGYGARLGTRHEVSQTERLAATLETVRFKFKGEELDTAVNFSSAWDHQINPRTKAILSYSNGQATSFLAGQSRFRSQGPLLIVTYELTPLLTWNAGGRYQKQTGGVARQEQYNWGTSLMWQIREPMRAKLSYSNTRSTSRDITDHVVSVSAEIIF